MIVRNLKLMQKFTHIGRSFAKIPSNHQGDLRDLFQARNVKDEITLPDDMIDKKRTEAGMMIQERQLNDKKYLQLHGKLIRHGSTAA